MPQKKKKAVAAKSNKEKIIVPSQSPWITQNSGIIFAAFLAIITFLIYSNTLGSGFVLLDDTAKIQENQLIRGFSLSNISAMFSLKTFVFHTYFPVTLLSYALDYTLWGGLKPHGFHFTNLLLHTINVLLLFFFTKRFTGKNNAAFIAALLLAAHPMNVESVAWLSERSNLMYSMFFIASMIFYLKHTENRRKINYTVFTYFFFLLSLLSKSSAVILPLVFILIDYFQQGKFSLKIIFSKIPYLALSLVFGLIAIYATTSTGNISKVAMNYTLYDRIFMVFYPMVYYVVKFFTPVYLSIVHPYPVKTGGFLPLPYYLSLLPVLLFIFISVKYKPLKKVLVFAFLFFLLNISVLLMIVPIGGNFLIAEHFVYVPYIGFAIAAGIVFSMIRDKIMVSRIPAGTLLALYYILIPLFCIATFSRNKVWKDSTALFTDLAETNPDNSFSHYGMGTIYLEKSEFETALSEFNLSVQLDSTYPDAYYNRAIAEINLLKFDSALTDLDQTILLSPDYLMAYVNRGNIKMRQGDTTGALNDFNNAIDISRDNAIAYYNRGRLKMNIKEYEEAVTDFNRAVLLNPEYTDAYNNRGITKFYLKDYKGSVQDYDVVLKLDKNYVNAYKNRGLSELAMNDSTSACNDFYTAFGMGLKDAIMLVKKNCK